MNNSPGGVVKNAVVCFGTNEGASMAVGAFDRITIRGQLVSVRFHEEQRPPHGVTDDNAVGGGKHVVLVSKLAAGLGVTKYFFDAPFGWIRGSVIA